jgi:histone deacetylase complex regulatory component SIN3
VYEDFLEILHAYQEKRATDHAIEQVKGQVQNLFRGHPDLLDDFNYFLPPEAGGTMSSAKQPKKKKQKKEEAPIPVSIPPPTPVRRVEQPSSATTAPLRVGLPLTQASSPATGPSAVRRLSGNVGALIPPGPYATVSYPPDSRKEMQLFEKIRVTIGALFLEFRLIIRLDCRSSFVIRAVDANSEPFRVQYYHACRAHVAC